MEKNGVAWLAVFWLLGIFVAKCSAIRCYQCNSLFDHRCKDPFDNYTIGLVNCDLKPPQEHLKGLNATVCRKLIQKVNDEVRIIRGCGYLNRTLKCTKRTGTHNAEITYCACTTDLCNLGNVEKASVRYILFLSSLTMMVFTSFLRIS